MFNIHIQKINGFFVLIFAIFLVFLALPSVSNAATDIEILQSCIGKTATGSCSGADVNGDGLAIIGAPDLLALRNVSKYDLNGNGIVEYKESISSPDQDSDGIPDNIDNCKTVSNTNQLDRGGIGLNSAPDGIGDACQCGDVNGDGVTSGLDATIITRDLLGLEPKMTQPKLCDVGGAIGCTTEDATTITNASLNIAGYSVTQQCVGPISNAVKSITVKTPNGGETYKQGDIIQITWDTVDFGNFLVSLDMLSKDPARNSLDNIATGILNTGTYSWKIPDDFQNGEYKIMASSFDKGPTAQDYSNNFFTIGTPLVYLSPTITNFIADMPSNGSYITLQWGVSAPTNVAIDFVCSGGLIEFYVKEDGRTVGCAKGGLVSYTNQSGNTISLTPQNNISPVTVSFTLSLIPNGYPASEKKTVTLTIPAQINDTTPTSSQKIVLNSPSEFALFKVGELMTVGWTIPSGNEGVWAVSLEPVDNSLVNEIFLYGMKAPGSDPILWGSGSKTFNLIDSPTSPYYVSGTYKLKIWVTSDGVKNLGVADSRFINIKSNVSVPTQYTAPIGVFNRNLWRGLRGDDVQRLQQLLGVEQTGYFGILTQSAVQNFQCKYNIVCGGIPDSTGYGIVGPLTLKKLNEVYGNTNETTGTSQQSVNTQNQTSTNSVGSSGLSQAQINAIIGLLQAFGADQAVIANVKAAL